MRVLYAGTHYPKFSESYVAAEISYAVRNGVDVAVWSPEPGSDRVPELVPVLRGTLEEALEVFCPDIVHAYYAFASSWRSALAPAVHLGIPVTVRGHRFPHEPGGAEEMAKEPWVHRIWMFPAFCKAVRNEKISALPVAFDSTRWDPIRNPYGWKGKDRLLVVRTAAGKTNKGLGDFIDIAKLLPDFRFKLIVDRSGHDDYIDSLEKRARGHDIEILRSIEGERVVNLVAQAGTYLYTADMAAGAPFGMPISLAEAGAMGCYIVARAVPGLYEYMNCSADPYQTIERAARMIDATRHWSEDLWAATYETSIDNSARYRDVHVLPEVLQTWRELI